MIFLFFFPVSVKTRVSIIHSAARFRCSCLATKNSVKPTGKRYFLFCFFFSSVIYQGENCRVPIDKNNKVPRDNAQKINAVKRECICTFLSAAKPRPWNCLSCCCCCVFIIFLDRAFFNEITLVDNNVATNCVILVPL